MCTTVRSQAVADILQDLYKQGKCFIAFRKDLDETMDKLVDEQVHLQESLSVK